jgi:hypothetical protein
MLCDGADAQLWMGGLEPAPVVQGQFIDVPASDDDASMDDAPAVPLPPDIRDMKLYLLSCGPYPGVYIAAKTGPNSMTKYLTNPTTGLVYSGLPSIPLHVKVASTEAAVEEIRKSTTPCQALAPRSSTTVAPGQRTRTPAIR